jgi:hypothetical protein
MNLPDKITERVRAWPHWSRAERRRLDEITDEILGHCANGTGNRFVREWCSRVLADLFRAAGGPEIPPADRIPTRENEEVSFAAHGRTFVVKKLYGAVWFLKATDQTRGRFGDKQQIREDIEHATEFGVLPSATGAGIY